ncbi:hypothetical protein SAMN05444413_11240 [Roseivivax marinus]|uniref:hypothetical protein n=1 Tax=Roseivivax marinus TaxID=1379903 RepID=UPI0008B46D42|nr:hypothetical protein [Roseivivax marinus]SEL62669.1 hypothetical protein SAMN05444413_11240 [Roseivivax marinus]
MDAITRHIDAEPRGSDAETRSNVAVSRHARRGFDTAGELAPDTEHARKTFPKKISSEPGEETKIPIMLFATIHSKLKDRQIAPSSLPERDPLPYLTAFSILCRIEGVPLLVLPFEGTDFSSRFPKSRMPENSAKHFRGDLAFYQSWRRLILDAQVIAEPGLVDCEPWDTIIRVARICRGADFSSRLYHVSSRVPTDTLPIALDRQCAIELDADLSGQDRASFRQGLGALDALHDESLAKRTGLLPEHKVGSLPKPSDHRTRYPLAPRLARVWEEMPAAVKPALVFAWRMAILGRVFSLEDDPSFFELMSEDRARALMALRTEAFGIKRPSQNTYSIYLQRLGQFCISLGGGGLPGDVCPVEQQWIALRALAKKHGTFSPGRVANIAAISTPAKLEGLTPRDLTPDWFSTRIAGLPAEKRRAFQSGCYVIDELSAAFGRSVDVLPVHGTGVRRQRRQD